LHQVLKAPPLLIYFLLETAYLVRCQRAEAALGLNIFLHRYA